DYKKEPGEKKKLQEKNSKWINDDYVKFMRYGQHFVEKNGEGVLAYINNHGFLDNPTFRGMRWHLLKTFDKIYILDLHGNSKKKEKTPSGGKDENVFDILPGVSINILIKKNESNKKIADVFHTDFWGLRNNKYNKLQKSSINALELEQVNPIEPFYFLSPRDIGLQQQYNKGLIIKDLFPV